MALLDRNQLVVEDFLGELVKRFGRHQVYTDGGSHYLAACKSLDLEHRVYRFGSWMHEVIERANELNVWVMKWSGDLTPMKVEEI
ncbi:hypothetical protein HRbin02_00711 [Candidatus Calditenuaceae archaeon HR02]|nr:hypothetical protein HRbin02_00711 [Candidatus Calditenuaceae archaeon HR02]